MLDGACDVFGGSIKPDAARAFDVKSLHAKIGELTLKTSFCIELVEEVPARFGKPDILYTDQRSQFASIAAIKTLKEAEIKFSIDGKSAWRELSSSNDGGGPSNTKKFICTPTPVGLKCALPLANILPSTSQTDRIHRLIDKHPI